MSGFIDTFLLSAKSEGRISIVDNPLKRSLGLRSRGDRSAVFVDSEYETPRGATETVDSACVRLEVVQEEDMLKTTRKGSLTQLALITGVACLCLGLAYGLLTAPICWQCWSHGTHARIGEILVHDSKDEKGHRTLMRWWCDHCLRAWKPGVPWIDDPPNFKTDLLSGGHMHWPWKGSTELVIDVPNGRIR